MRAIKSFWTLWFVSLTISLLLIAASPTTRPKSSTLPTSRATLQTKNEKKENRCSIHSFSSSLLQPPKRIGLFPARNLIYFGGLRSYFEPCGCQANMLGGLTRFATLLESYRRKGHALLPVDAGNLFFEKFVMEKSKRVQNQIKAEMIADLYRKMKIRVIGFGPHDLVLGRNSLKKLQNRSGAVVVASNMIDSKTLRPIFPTRTIVFFKGLRIGFFSLTSSPPKPATKKQAKENKAGVFPSSFWADRGVSLLPALSTARREIQALRSSGAQLIVLLSTMKITQVKAILRNTKGIDFALDGLANLGLRTPLKIGHSLLLSPPKEGQKAGLLSLFWRKGMASWEAVETAGILQNQIDTNRKQTAAYLRQAKAMEAQGAAFKPIASVYFKQAKALVAKNQQIQRRLHQPLQLPKNQQGFVHALLPLSKELSDCHYVLERVSRYQKDVKRANVQALQNIKPILVNAQGNSFVGASRCQMCHVSQYRFWQKTRHAHAYATLVKKNKQFDLDCIGCHVVGWQKPGGLYKLQKPQRLANVQCENCHSYGAIHATKQPTKKTIQRVVPASVCQGCHQNTHDPSFHYLDKLKKILGKGHGEKRLLEILRSHNAKK